MKTPVYSFHFATQLRMLSNRERGLVKQAAEAYCKTGEASNLIDLGDHKRFTVEGVTVQFEEDENSVMFTTIHRFARG